MIYIAITFFLFCLRYLLKDEEIAKKQIYYIILFLIFLFSSYRFQVGCDWYGYYKLFLKIDDWSLQRVITTRDPLSMLLIYFIRKLDMAYPYIYIAFNIVFFLGIHFLAKRQQDPLGFLILLFPILVINMSMSGVRQAAAIGIICISFLFFLDRKPIKYSLLVLLAALFHSSAIIFLFFLPFASGRFNNNRLMISFFFVFFGLILLTFSKNFQYAVSVYIDSGREAYGSVFRIGALTLSGLYFYLFAKNKWKMSFGKDYVLVNLGAMSMILLIFLVPISTIISDRFGYYFIPIQAIIFARMPFLPFKNNQNLYVFLPYVFIFSIFIFWTQMSALFDQCYLPYKTWFFGIPSEDMLK